MELGEVGFKLEGDLAFRVEQRCDF